MNNKIKQRFINYWNSRSSVDYSTIPFTIEMLENGDLTWNLVSSKDITSLQYQVNNDTPVEVSLVSGSQTVSISNLASGDKVKFNGTATKYVSSDYQNTSIKSTGYFKVYGNVMSLYYDDDFSDKTAYPTTTAYNLNGLFNGSTKLTDAENLILPALRLYGRTYRDFFMNCTSLVKAPKILPATIVDNHDYMSMFYGCTSLTTVPDILATQCIDKFNFREMFYGCTSLVKAPAIISVNMDKQGTCQSMFYGCTSLTTAPELPATTLGQDAYREMFYGCTSLTTAPELPATTIASCSYSYMFYNCTSLTIMPDILFTTYTSTGDPGLCSYMFSGCTNLTTLKPLKLTTYPRGSLQHMFQDCTSLVDASIFDMSNFTATESNGEGAFDSLFAGCTSLTTPPKLPTFQHCPRMAFREMFRDCTSLTTAPEIKATSYGYGALWRMFKGCTSLTTAPILYATTLSTNNYGYGCCEEMFDGCKNINYIKSFATSQPVKDTTFNWLRGVSNTGTIDCMFPLVFDLNTPNGIPTGWTYNYMNTGEMLKFVNKGNTTATIGWHTQTNDPKTIKYSKDNENWTSISSTGDMATLAQNEVLYIKATNSNYGYTNAYVGSHFTMNGGEISVEGNIMSLIDEDNFSELDVLTAPAAFGDMFQNCTSLKYADKLQLLPTTLTEYCYHHMFYGCTSLTIAPTLSATTLANNCYYGMFSGCTSLTNAPALPVTTLTNECYNCMFSGCTSLTTAPVLPATRLTVKCYYRMFEDCTSLTTAPTLSATTLSENCCEQMFKGCTSLTAAPKLPATTLAYGCYAHMFEDCTSLTTAPTLSATTLMRGCYSEMFRGCTSLTTAPLLNATSLVDYCYYNMFNGCSKINKINILATDISAGGCLDDWLKDTASTGTIYYDVNSITLPIDSDSGIPVGWTGIDIYSLPESKYLATEALEDGTITFSGDSSSDLTSLSYRVNGGNWTTTTTPKTTTTVNVLTGDKVEWRASATKLTNDWQHGSHFGGTSKFNVSGNILSMIYDTNFVGQNTVPGSICRLFDSSKVVDASNLIINIVDAGWTHVCRLFINCTELIKGPYKLSNITGNGDAYIYCNMFEGCTSLTTAPILTQKTPYNQEFERAFLGCTSLQYVEIWTNVTPSYSRGNNYVNEWLKNTTSGTIVGYKNGITGWYAGSDSIPSTWTFIDMEYTSNDITYYASKDYAAHVLGYESPQDAIDAGYTLQTVTNTDNNWDYYLYSAA